MSVFYQVKSVETILEQSKQYLIGLGSTLTNFNEGSRIRSIFLSTAQILHQCQYDFLQGIRASIPTAVYNGFEFERLPGNKSAGTLVFTRNTPATGDITIPIGSAVTLNGIIYETIEEGLIDISVNPSASNDIAARATSEGIAGNLNSSNEIDTLIGQGSFVSQPINTDNCYNSSPFSGGSDEESDEDRLSRFRLFINGLARTTPIGIQAGALSVAGVLSATVVSNFPTPGYVTVFADDGTGSLAVDVKAELEKVLNGDPADVDNYPGYAAAGIHILVDEPLPVSFNLSFEIRILNTAQSDDAELEAIAKDAAVNYVNTLNLGFDYIETEMICSVKAAHPDIYDVIAFTPTSNIAINPNEVARTDGSLATITSQRVGP